jgi:hypothetical protein
MDSHQASAPVLDWVLVVPLPRRTAGKTDHLPIHRNLRKRPLVHPVNSLYRNFSAFAIRYESLLRFTG